MQKNKFILLLLFCSTILSYSQVHYCIDSISLAPPKGASGIYQVHIAFPYLLYTSVRDTLNSEDIWITKIDKNGKVISESRLTEGITTMDTEGSPFYSKKKQNLVLCKIPF